MLSDGQIAYLQLVSDSPVGEVVRVLAGRFEEPCADVRDLVEEAHEYMMFTTVRLLLKDGYAKNAGNFAVPSHGTWSGLRYMLIRGRSGEVVRRVLSDGSQAVEQVPVLPPPGKRRSFPLWWVGPSADAMYHLMASRDRGLEPAELEAWKRERGFLKPETGTAQLDEAEGARHFAAFAKGAQLDGVIRELGRAGYAAELFDDPDAEEELLVITTGSSVPESVNEQWDQVAGIVESAGGEYDGWEAEASAPSTSRNSHPGRAE
jgi:hypothetical protein